MRRSLLTILVAVLNLAIFIEASKVLTESDVF